MRFNKATLCVLLAMLSFVCCSRQSEENQFLFFDDVLVQDATGIPNLNRLGPENLEEPKRKVIAIEC